MPTATDPRLSLRLSPALAAELDAAREALADAGVPVSLGAAARLALTRGCAAILAGDPEPSAPVVALRPALAAVPIPPRHRDEAGPALLAWRQARGISPDVAAARVGAPRYGGARWTRWERGEIPPAELLPVFEEIAGVPVAAWTTDPPTLPLPAADLPATAPEALALWRQRYGLKVPDAAARAGTNGPTWRRWESGEAPRPDLQRTLAVLVGVPVDRWDVG